MLKNKKMIGILVGICILFCSVVILTTISSKPKETISQATTNVDNSTDIENNKTIDQSMDEKTKESEKNNASGSSQKSEQNATKEEKSSAKDTNQSQSKTEPNKATTPESTTQYVYVSIDCKTILKNMNNLSEEYKQFVPSNGIILSSKKVKINQGDTVFDIITKVAKMNKIQMSQSAGYIQSIHNLPEKIFNGSGGWMYGVNGSYADKGSKEYKLKNNDKVEWRYTCYIGDIY